VPSVDAACARRVNGSGSLFWKEGLMLRWAVIFLIVAIVAAIFGFTGIAGVSSQIAWILFVVFIILFIVSLVMGRRGPPAV
jgi:uncharacterized membrane protein YtjA (UPF0391 family)